jgi:hypothetical protein
MLCRFSFYFPYAKTDSKGFEPFRSVVVAEESKAATSTVRKPEKDGYLVLGSGHTVRFAAAHQ